MANKRLGRTVFITGATSDIGRAIAMRFAREGWNVSAHYNTLKERAGMLKDDLEGLDVRCALFKADLSSKKDIAALLKDCEGMNIDSLINNAGTYFVNKYFGELTLDDMISTFTVNTFAPVLLASGIFAGMKKRGFGRIVNISSIAAKYGGSANSMHYGCSKRALEGLTKTMAREGAPHNVLVNTIRPGVIDTEFHKKFPKDMTRRIAMIPAGRMGKADDVAELAYYLGSDENNYITNETIAVSGGE